MAIYEIVEWRLEWLSRGGTLLNIAERKRGSSRGTDLERKLWITDCNERKMKIANLWVSANLSTFHASLPASRDAAVFNNDILKISTPIIFLILFCLDILTRKNFLRFLMKVYFFK